MIELNVQSAAAAAASVSVATLVVFRDQHNT